MHAILSGRDAETRADGGDGWIAAYLLPILLLFKGEHAGPRALILAAAPPSVQSIAREYQRLVRSLRDAPDLVCLGEVEDARKEARRLERPPVVLAGTTERVIDHIRRGNVSLNRVQTVVIEQRIGQPSEDFAPDVQFIYAKLPPRRHTLLLVPEGTPSAAPVADQAAPAEGVTSILRRPVAIASGTDSGPVDHCWYPVDGRNKLELLVAVLLSRHAASAVVFHSGRTNGASIAGRLAAAGFRAQVLPSAGSASVRRRLCEDFQRREVEALCVSSPPPAELDLAGAGLIVYYDLPVHRTPNAAGRPTGAANVSVIALGESSQAKELARVEELHGIAMKQENPPTDIQTVKGSLDRIMQRIRELDRGQLDGLRTLVRKNVPFFMRSYVLAFLLKAQLPVVRAEDTQAVGRPRGRQRAHRGDKRAESGRVAAPAARGRVEQAPAAPAAASSARGPDRGLVPLFVSVGRNRRVYPRDLTALFVEKVGLRPDEIGTVRIFDKYSFVEVPRSRAEDAISRLSGTEFKGRSLTVNFGKKKDGTDAS